MTHEDDPSRPVTPDENPSDPASPPVDLNKLRQELAEVGAEDVLDEVVEAYVADAPGRMDAIVDAVEAGDAEAIGRAAHAYKSSSAQVGATRLHELLKELEASAVDAPSGSTRARDARALVEEIRAEHARALAYLRGRRHRRGGHGRLRGRVQHRGEQPRRRGGDLLDGGGRLRRSPRELYDRLAGSYDRIANAAEHEARERGERLLSVEEGERVLEVGYGTGHSLVNLAAAGGRVTGIDVSEGMLAVARERVADAGLADRVRLLLGDARSMPFRGGRFDAAFASFTVELFEGDDLRLALAELRRVLRPGGRVVVVSLFDGGGLPLRIYKWVHRSFPHLVDCRPIRTAAVLEGAGFQIGRWEQLSIWGLPVIAVRADKP